MIFGLAPRRAISATTYVELVRSLLGTFVPGVVMGIMFIVIAGMCARHSGDIVMLWLSVIGSVVSMVRAVVLTVFRSAVAKCGLDLEMAQSIELPIAASYLTFALTLGAFTARALVQSPVQDKTAVAALVVGYAAGVAAGAYLRPWIAVPAMLLAVVPAIAACFWLGGAPPLVLAFLLTTLLAAGIASVVARYRDAVEMIEMRQRFASLAGLDPLTGLANRFALEDRFMNAVKARGGGDIIFHCFDLDRFKPVNDSFGHPVGDLLLQAVAKRLDRLLRPGDLAVRLGGDEFAVLQTGVQHADEGRLLARRIARSLADPYSIDGHEIRIGASVGSASGRDHGPDLARLMVVADEQLYEVKNGLPAHRALAG